MTSTNLTNVQDNLDPGFGPDGTGIVWPKFPIDDNSKARGITITDEGKLLIAGGYGRSFSIVRLTDKGYQDPTFGINGVVTGVFEDGYRSEGYSISILKSGELLLTGGFNRTDFGDAELGLALFDSNGTPVKTFGTNGVTVLRPLENVKLPTHQASDGSATNSGSFSSELPDGKFMVFINHQFNFVESAGLLMRLNRNGAIDETFDPEGKGYVFIRHSEYSTWIGSMISLADGRFAFGGSAVKDERTTSLIAVYNADGTPSYEFGTKGFVLFDALGDSNQIIALTMLGPHILGMSNLFGPPCIPLLVCLDTDGKAVKSFNGGKPLLTPIDDVPFGAQWVSGHQRNEGFVVTGSTLGEEDSKIIIAQYLPDGRLDNRFGKGGLLRLNLTDVLDVSVKITVQSDGKIVGAGYSVPVSLGMQGFVFRCVT